MRATSLRMLVAAGLAAGLLAGAAPTTEGAATCTLAPQLREVAVDQGLPGYTRLVRGKETLVRPFFTLPSCADVANGANIQVKSATLSVKNGATVLASGIATAATPLGPTYPLIATPSSATTLPPDAAGNPIFVVPGSVLAPAASTASYTASFELTVTYAGQPNSASAYTADTTTVFTTPTGSRAAITKTVEKLTNALRILAVPMGGTLSAAGVTNLQNAFTTASRMWPVPDGTVLSGTPGPRTGDLFGGSGGIRYSLNSGTVDLTGLLDASGNFCGSSTNWSAVKSQLAQFLQSWNSVNTTAQADRVSGVGDPATTIGAPTCAEGMASVVSSENWFRASADKAGPTLVMETCHTFGCVPSARSDGAYHSIYPNADFTAGDTDRGYNVTNRTYLADDKNAMRFNSLWSNANTIFGRDDYAMMLCKLGGATTSDCSTSGVAGTSAGVAAGVSTDSFVISGTTNGTQAGTKVLESFKAATLPTPSDAASPYRLRQFNGAAQVADDGVPVSVDDSVHSADGPQTSQPSVFSIAFPLAAGANRVQLVYAPAAGSTVVLYETGASAAPVIAGGLAPTTLAPSTVGPGGTTTTSSSSTTAAKPGNPDPGRPSAHPMPERPPTAGGPKVASAATAVGITPVASDAIGAGTIATAIAADPAIVTGASFTAFPPSGTPNGVDDSALNVFPTNGSSFGILTSGDVKLADTPNSYTSSGTADGGGNVRGNTDFDVSILKVDLNVPAGANCLAVDFKFLSEEYPEYVGSPYNDSFVAELDTSSWTTSGSTISAPNNFAFDPAGNPISINATGNTSMSAAEASGTTYDGATPLLTAKTAITPGAHSLYLSIFDQSDQVFDSAVFLDNLVVGTTASGQCVQGAQPKDTTNQTVTFTATDDGPPTDLRADIFLNTNGMHGLQILAVGRTANADGTFTFTTPVGCAGCTIQAKVYDGFESSALTTVSASTATGTPPPADPVPAINSPPPGASVRQYDPVTLDGSGWDAQDGVLAGTGLSWSAPCLGVAGQTGTSIYLAPPANGWTPGPCTVTLTVTDSNGHSATTSRSFELIADADHDNIPASLDVTCAGAGADGDPLNALSDYDGDGIPNGSDPQPCIPATLYDHGFGEFVNIDGTLSTSSPEPHVLTAKVRVGYVPGMRFVPLTNVRISQIDGRPVSGLQALHGGSGGDEHGVWLFDRQAVVAVLTPLGVNRAHVLTLRGDATAPRTWAFEIPIEVFLSSG